MTSPDLPLLSICIPTFNRAVELRETLRILCREINQLPPEQQAMLELLVSDNHSDKFDPHALVAEFQAKTSCAIQIHQQAQNVGPTRNFEYCYNRSNGHHVFILSDDDHLCPGTLQEVMRCLLKEQPDIVFLPFYETPDPTKEATYQKLEANDFLKEVNLLPTLISSCILKRSLLDGQWGKYLDTNMHHFHYFLQALENGNSFVMLSKQALYSPYAENSGGYNWFSAFADHFFRIIDEFDGTRVSHKTLKSIQRKMLVDRIIPTFVNTKINGYTINTQFNEAPQRTLMGIIHKRCKKLVEYWIIFLPLALTPSALLRITKKIYLLQRQHLFQWH